MKKLSVSLPTVACFSILLTLKTPSTAAPISNEKSAAAAVRQLTVISDGMQAGMGSFDFGIAELMDSKQSNADIQNSTWSHPVLPGIKHLFVLQNNTLAPLTISFVEPDSIAVAAEILGIASDKKGFYTIAPAAKIKIKMAFDYYLILPGKVSEKVYLRATGSKIPLATLEMKGIIKGGVNFSDSVLDFGNVVSGNGALQDFSLIFDRRTPREMIPAPIKLVSKNPYIKIISIPSPQTVMGVKIEDNTLIFPGDDRDMPNDLKLDFRAELSKDAPIGALSGQIGLIMPRFPSLLTAQGRQDVLARCSDTKIALKSVI